MAKGLTTSAVVARARHNGLKARPIGHAWVARVSVCPCVRLSVRAFVRACVCPCVRVRLDEPVRHYRACVHVCVLVYA